MVDSGKPIIVGVGEILWDMLPGGKVLGGAPTNFAYHCRQMGADSYVISAIGKDDAGCEILERVEALGIPSDFLFIEKHFPTSTVTVKLDEKGHPEYTIHENVAWDHIPADPLALDRMKAADAVCFGSLAQRSAFSRKSIQAYLEVLPADCLRVFDVNLRQHFYSKELIEESLGFADVLKLNDDELLILSELFSIQGGEDKLIETLRLSFNLKLIALTRGGAGSTLFTGTERSDYRSDAVHAVDTVGAGDSFTAAMVMTYLKGVDLKDIHRLASELAAYVCTQKGATPKVPAHLLEEIVV